MAISNFPLALQPIIQQGFLEREFQAALTSKLAYRSIADREIIANGVGETVTKTRAGLLAPTTTPISPSTNTNLDNGLTVTNWGVEQYSISIQSYGSSMDLNTVTNRVGIKDQFLTNASRLGTQAAQSLDRLARAALTSSYFGGNSYVRVALGTTGPTIQVNDIRGFQFAFYLTGFTSAAQLLASGAPAPTQQAISSSNTLLCTVGSNTYTLTGATADGTNVSTTPGGISGTLTFSASVATTDATLGAGVQASNGCFIARPVARTSLYSLTSSDLLTMSVLEDAVAKLRSNAVEPIDGAYNCYLDPTSGRQLFADSDFRQLFQGATANNETYKQGMINSMLGLRFLPTTEAYVQAHPTIAGAVIRRPVIVGQGALIEGDFAGMGATNTGTDNAEMAMVDGICMVTREPIDRLQQIVAQSWYWMGGFCTPSDVLTNNTIVPTASNATYKRAVIVEHIA